MMHKHHLLIIIILWLLPIWIVPPVFAQSTDTNWPMSGHDPERSSWTPEEVRGPLKPLWYRVVDPYISRKVQIIAANNMLYVATSKGLVALNPDTGATNWTYPTELPLGNSPTFVNGILYVPGLDKMVHAVNATTGTKLWTSVPADAGFQTNPVVINNKVYLGNRDGYFYAYNTSDGTLAWKFKTDGAILYSAAYKNGTLYFASQDSYAYAINEQGQQLWKTKLTGAGFTSWWPVIYRNRVIFSGNPYYKNLSNPGLSYTKLGTLHFAAWPSTWTPSDNRPMYTTIGPQSFSIPGNWVAGTRVIDAQAALDLYTRNPHYKAYFVLDQTTGTEVEQAPVLYFGTHSGNRFPPVVSGFDDVIYQVNEFYWGGWIGGGQVSGWKIGTPYISVIFRDWGPEDEPNAISGGGRMIYRNQIVAREAAGADISMPLSCYPEADNNGCQTTNRQWDYLGYDRFNSYPNLMSNYGMINPDNDVWYPFGNENGIYGDHGDVTPLIPYKGKLFTREMNSIMAYAPNVTTTQNPANISNPSGTVVQAPSTVDTTKLKTKLESEITKMIQAGHLRPAYLSSGLPDGPLGGQCGYAWGNAWDNPEETLYTLSIAYPYVSSTLQQQIKTYLYNNYIREDINGITSYPVWKYASVGWKNGANRSPYTIPPETLSQFATIDKYFDKYTTNDSMVGFTYSPFSFYAMWKYAQLVDGGSSTTAKFLYDKSKTRLAPAPTDAILAEFPHAHNMYVAGYKGYLELEKLAGYAETASVKNEYNRLLSLRASAFKKTSPFPKNDPVVPNECRNLNVATNFMFMTPELGQYLRSNAMTKVQDAMNDYNYLAPYWLVNYPEEGLGETVTGTLYTSWAMFQAKTQIMQEPANQLVKYLDTPVFAVGDLYYIQNLATLLSMVGTIQPTPLPTSSCGLPGDVNCSGKVDTADLLVLLGNFGKSGSGDVNNSGKVDTADLLVLLGNFGK